MSYSGEMLSPEGRRAAIINRSPVLRAFLHPSYRPDEGLNEASFCRPLNVALDALPKTFYQDWKNAGALHQQLVQEGVFNKEKEQAYTYLALILEIVGYQVGNTSDLDLVKPDIIRAARAKQREAIATTCTDDMLAMGIDRLFLYAIPFRRAEIPGAFRRCEIRGLTGVPPAFYDIEISEDI